MKYAIISTEKGDMKAELYEKETPVTVENFVNLAGKRFYDYFCNISGQLGGL
mgnify:CR=1 FL=1